MDTTSCVMRGERFISRRDAPTMIWSDSGTKFIGTERQLCKCIGKWNKINIAAELAQKLIKWKFNSPSAPLQDGIWERLVLGFKRVLYTILCTRRFADEVLNTTFCLIDYAVNARPLTPVSADSSELGTITPNYFPPDNQVTGILSIVDVDEFDHRKRYARAQSYVNANWERWLKEYVSFF